MNYSEQKLGFEARKLLLSGAEKVYSVVSATLGARGRNIVLWKTFQTKSIHDGVKIAQRVNPKDPFENAGAEILKQAAQRQVDKVGDGTTAVIVLGYAIANEAQKLISSGINPMSLRDALSKGADTLVKEIEKLAKPVKTLKEKIEVATISSQSQELGKLIGETLDKCGVDGVITVEKSIGGDTFVEHEEGMQFQSGYRDQIFVTNPSNMTATVTDARILVTDMRLNDINAFAPLLNNVCNPATQDNPRGHGHKNLVVIADEIEGNVLATLAGNKYKGNLNVLCVKAPTFRKADTLRDIATLTGGKFVSDATDDLTKITYDDLGTAQRVTSSKDATVIVGGGGDKKSIEARVDSLKQEIKDETNEFNKQKLRERLAKLTGGVFVIYAGGSTEAEVEDKVERIDDSIQATRAAIRGGSVPGGEIIYLNILNTLKPKGEDEEYAYRILKKALELPFTKLVENGGYNAGRMMERLTKHSLGEGVDVTTGAIVDMRSKGILDPALVPIEAIKNGVSVATQLIISDGIVVEREKDQK